MSAPLIWVVFPLGAGVLLLLAGTTKAAARWGASVALLLAVLAWQVPIDQPVALVGDWGFRLAPALRLLGRQLTIYDPMRPLLMWLFLALALWLAVAPAARMEPTYVGLAMAFVTTLVAALTIHPFLYAAFLIETAALVAVPLLLPPGTRTGRGVLRFLTFQTLGALFVLFTGWMLTGTETSLPQSDLALRGGVLLGVGFALLMGVFPFHSWMPMLTEEIHPYASALVITAVVTVVSVLGVGFLDRYTWLRESAVVYDWLRVMGAVMVAVGGLFAAFQRHAGRVLGYAVMVDVGLGLAAVGLGQFEGVVLFFALWPVRALAFVTWALALSGLGRRREGLDYGVLAGLGRSYPWLAAAAVLAPLALAGAPWLGGYFTHLSIWRGVTASWGVLMALWVGSAGLAAAAFRLAGVLVVSGTAPWRSQEARDERWWVWALFLALVAAGAFHAWWWQQAVAIAQTFVRLRG